jgi:hypothetical protein
MSPLSLLLTILLPSSVAFSMPKYTRPGVEAAVRLAQRPDDKALWERVEGQYSAMIQDKGGYKLTQLDSFCENLGEAFRGKNSTVSKDDFLRLIDWKFTKGKPRHALKKLLNSNSAQDIEQAWNEATAKATDDDIKGAIDSFSVLKGVGPATASAFLSLYKPESFMFMDDEVIECLHEGTRGYTVKIYLELNEKCINLGKELGWTPRKVGRALWTAARIHASGGEDLTNDRPNAAPLKVAGKKKHSLTSSSEPSPSQLPKKQKR